MDTIRIALIGYSLYTDKKLLSNIIFESSAGDVIFSELHGYTGEEPSLFYKDMNKILKFVSKYKHIIADDIFD